MSKKIYDIIVVGGGAAGFFAAVNSKEYGGNLSVAILEKTTKFLSKVKVSGGGRCNVTNAEPQKSLFLNHYPRGKNFLKKAFSVFDPETTIKWFEENGLKLKTEPDGRMFPLSNTSQSVIDLFMSKASALGIELLPGVELLSFHKEGDFWFLSTSKGSLKTKNLIIAMGGMAKPKNLIWAKDLAIETVSPVPSLFTFKSVEKEITKLMGLSKGEVSMRIAGIKRKETGPLLITHWGFSGPATIKTSAWLARELHQKGYAFEIGINWLNEVNEEELLSNLSGEKKIIKNVKMDFPQRLWEYLLNRAKVDAEKVFFEMTKKDKFRLINTLINDTYKIEGKSTFKEEFVTAGGIALSEVNPKTMETHKHKGLYICGETLDIDGVTGGFNFQAAWTTGYIAGINAAKDLAII